ncbi:MAG: TadE/TadG family type IV pilus assembly protein [bacterium]|jgi:hypothetical protein
MLVNINRLLQSEKGQTLVELALIFPILCLLLLGLVEFGRVFHAYLVLTNASREGAREAAVGKGDVEVQARVIQTASTLNNGSLVVSIEPGEGERSRGTGVTVRATYQLPIIAPLITNILPNPLPIQTATTMRVE